MINQWFVSSLRIDMFATVLPKVGVPLLCGVFGIQFSISMQTSTTSQAEAGGHPAFLYK